MATIAKLVTKNPLYVATESQMGMYLSAYLNDETFRRTVRTKRPSEDAQLWADCVRNTVAQPIARWVVETINSTVFEPGIQRELKFVSEVGTELPLEMAEWSELFLMDADLQNNNLNGVMENIGNLTSIFGMCWVFVDMPQDDGTPFVRRPYVVPVSPQYVWDWEFISVRGVNIPAYIKVLERETPECYYFKIYYIGTTTTPSYWECYEVEKRDLQQSTKELLPISSGTYPLGMTIPGFIAYTRRDPRLHELGISDIDVASGVQMEHYKLECDAYQALQFARTLIRAENGIKVPATAGGIVRATEGQIETLSVDTGDVEAIIRKQEQLLQDFQQMAGLGGLTRQRQQVQSGISIIEERRGLYRLAQAKARLLEICEETIWSYASRFMMMRWAGEVVYGNDYDSVDSTYKMALLKEANLLAPDNPVIQELIVENLIKMIAPQEEAEELIDRAKAYIVSPLGVTPVEEDEEDEEDDNETDMEDMEDSDVQAQAPETQEVEEYYTMDITDNLPTAQEQREAIADVDARSKKTVTTGAGTPIINTGPSFFPAESAAQMVLGIPVQGTGR